MIIVLFGVSGAGKTTIGRLLAADLGWQFYEGDDFHPSANIEKMRSRISLTDSDRRPWLEKLRALIDECIDRGENAVLACSALKETYRLYLSGDRDQVKFVHLQGDYALVQERLKNRRGHFMNPKLLDSQFATLEEAPGNAIVVAVDQSPAEIVKGIRWALKV
jgi:gluconokinase